MGKKSSDSMSSVTRMTGSSDLIPLEQKVAYAAGMLVNNLQAAAIPAMMIVLNLGIGLDPRLVGIIGFIPRIFDAVSDPLMGYISDNTRSSVGSSASLYLSGCDYLGPCLCRYLAISGWAHKDVLFLVFSAWINSLFLDIYSLCNPRL